MLAVGGSSNVWTYNNPAWGRRVNKMVTMARSMGIPPITGERYLRLLSMAGGHEHAEETDENARVFLTWFQDMHSAAYAIFPLGSVRNQDARRDLAEELFWRRRLRLRRQGSSRLRLRRQGKPQDRPATLGMLRLD